MNILRSYILECIIEAYGIDVRKQKELKRKAKEAHDIILKNNLKTTVTYGDRINRFRDAKVYEPIRRTERIINAFKAGR